MKAVRGEGKTRKENKRKGEEEKRKNMQEMKVVYK